MGEVLQRHPIMHEEDDIEPHVGCCTPTGSLAVLITGNGKKNLDTSGNVDEVPAKTARPRITHQVGERHLSGASIKRFTSLWRSW